MGKRIHTRQKIDPSHSERTVKTEETLRHANRIAAAKGVTRVADITGLDRLGIPVHCAVVPRSEDGLSVYNGKGIRKSDSRVGALMEAIECQTALAAELHIIDDSYRNLRARSMAVADPRSFNHKLSADYDENTEYWWVEAFDLVAEEPILVPAGLAGYGPKYMGSHSPYEINSSNGLASGNCFEEAVCHGLCELLERDAWTLADLKSRWIPLARLQEMFGSQIAAFADDDPNAYPRIEFQDAGQPFIGLIESFKRAGLAPVARDITGDFGIPSVMAAVADDSVPGFPQAHAGMGAHPNARIAAMRALTELAQSRVVDIQGVREDLKPVGVPVQAGEHHLQRVQKIQPQRWLLQQTGRQRRLCDLHSSENDDIAEDIQLILSRLTANGIERVIVLDLSEPGPFSVVRVMAPGLEFWALEQGALGGRATRFWRDNY